MFNIKRILATAILCFTALICPMPIAAQNIRPVVAVFEPESQTDQHGVATARLTPQDKMIIFGTLEQGLLSSGQYRVVDRTRSEKVSMENRYIRENSTIDISMLKKMGEILQADLVCVSLVYKNQDVFVADCSIINVETGELTNNRGNVVKEFKGGNVEVMIKNAMLDIVNQMFISQTPGSGGTENPLGPTITGGRQDAESSVRNALKKRVLGDRLKRDISNTIWQNISWMRRINKSDFRIDVDLSNLDLSENSRGDRYMIAGRLKVTVENLKADKDATTYFEIKTNYVNEGSIHDEIVIQVKNLAGSNNVWGYMARII